MRTVELLKRNLVYYWRTNLSVVIGVASAVAVLAGALLVGDSVRASLSDLVLQRIGNTNYVVSAPSFFRDHLAAELQQSEDFKAAFDAVCPMIVMRGSTLNEKSRQQAGQVSVYGVDERFWHFHSQETVQTIGNREAFISEALARDLTLRAGDVLLLRIEKPSDIPVESLHGRKEDQGRTLRLTIKAVLPTTSLGDFSLLPQQGAVRGVFVPLAFLQRELGQPAKVNTILISQKAAHRGSDNAAKVASLEKVLKEKASLEDFGIDLRIVSGDESFSIETQSKVLNDSLAEIAIKTANQMSLRTIPVLSYLANSINAGNRSIPYSLVTALDKQSFTALSSGKGESADSIILNEWAAKDLEVQPGETISLEYYLWHEDGHLETKSATFRLAAVVPISGIAADKNLVPQYPGITESQHLSDWDPPFPIDLSRVRKKDEEYWDQYRTTPKAFIQLDKGQELWKSRFGKVTSIRVTSSTAQPIDEIRNKYSVQLLSQLTPESMGIRVASVRVQGLNASRGATDFGEYFLYFSFFLVISALILTVLFFRLGIEQRVREIGVLEAMGFPPSKIRNLFLSEGLVLSFFGSVLGLVGAIAYGYLLLLGLRTWWVGAVGTTMLRLHVSWISLLIGAVGGIVAALVCIALTLRKLDRASARSLLLGSSLSERENVAKEKRRFSRYLTASRFAFVFITAGLVLLILASLKQIGEVAGFFGGGTLLLIGLLFYQSARLRRTDAKQIHGTGWLPVLRLGFRNATHRPGRSMLCIALIASAAFIIVAVDAFRRENNIQSSDKRSGNGGFPLLAESLVPLVHNPNTVEGREALNLTDDSFPQSKDVAFTRFRVRAGDDASCLNLYQPQNPKIIAPTEDFIASDRFTFQDSLARSNDEKANPWLLLNAASPDGSIPVIGDANSLSYVLHLKLGDTFVLSDAAGDHKLRVVGALSDSIFQSELIMAEKNFLHLFPQEQGFKLFLIDAPESETATVSATLEDRLSDYGFDAVSTVDRLREFHRVENTYLSTFQLLGGLGLVLGTLGMAAVLIRNVLERRRELALLRAVGYNSTHFALMVIAENAFLLFCGLATGTICALLAVAPVFFGRGGRLPNISIALLLLLVLVSGLTVSILATIVALRSPLIPALKSE